MVALCVENLRPVLTVGSVQPGLNEMFEGEQGCRMPEREEANGNEDAILHKLQPSDPLGRWVLCEATARNVKPPRHR